VYNLHYKFSYASRTWVKSTYDVMPMLDEASVDKGAKKEAAAAPGLGYVDLPNTQIRKVRSVPWDSSNLELFKYNFCLWCPLLLLTASNFNFLQVTANRLLQSKQTIPHYYLTVDSRVDKLIKYGIL
jgi:pyruvate dehydrogenase E2 component (dihydrolipoamide acetyltransferase)